jgi:aryl-alcohol dehydrogenase-like predicted oxidoreductase
VRAGKVLYLGISNTPAWIVSQANTLAGFLGWSPFVGLQIEYSLIERGPERDLLPMARAFDMAITPWGLLEGGELTGKYNQPASGPKRSEKADPKVMTLAEAVMKLAAEIGRTPSQVAINWVRQQPGVVIPILGARTEAQIKDNLGCLEFALTVAHMQQLRDANPIDLGFPHSFLASDHVHNLIFGETFALVDNHRA